MICFMPSQAAIEAAAEQIRVGMLHATTEDMARAALIAAHEADVADAAAQMIAEVEAGGGFDKSRTKPIDEFPGYAEHIRSKYEALFGPRQIDDASNAESPDICAELRTRALDAPLPWNEAKDRDRDIRAKYVFRHDCHMVVVEQLDTRNGAYWKTVTNLFVENAAVGERLASAITNAGRKEPLRS